MTYQVGDRVILNSIPGVTYSPANVIPEHLLWDDHEEIGKEFTISEISLYLPGRPVLTLPRPNGFEWQVYEADISPVESEES